MTSMSYVESCLAKNTIWWHEHTGHKVIYWSGSHSAVGHARTVSFPPAPPKTGRNAGSYLREHFGARYLSGGSLNDWFDLIIHHREATPAHHIS
jgi:erythromycin esterase